LILAKQESVFFLRPNQINVVFLTAVYSKEKVTDHGSFHHLSHVFYPHLSGRPWFTQLLPIQNQIISFAYGLHFPTISLLFLQYNFHQESSSKIKLC